MSHSPKLDRPEKDLGLIPSGLERFLTFLARATRNPIQSIWGALFVIQRRIDPRDETLAQAVRIIREEIDQLHELIQETLEFVRPVERKQIGPVDLNALLTSVLTALTTDPDGSAPPVSVATSLDPALPHKGNGLGTAIGHRIIMERCQGDMKPEQVAEEGLRLLVSLPIKGADSHEPID